MVAPGHIPWASSLPSPPVIRRISACSFSPNLCKGIVFIDSSLLFEISWHYHQYAPKSEKVPQDFFIKKEPGLFGLIQLFI
jgi:hypothetical protein